ncbi:hypothetical protein [Thalassospira sp.]|uniref:hypothetical protein n=1 Tax=Thalassospira sp. TaxID=1912094 RepID=UPI001B1ED1F2|nr:hypothetical protein [Thalassospira sp.]MBO6807682.1 hypothetical protein [Thalassospira sp.]MBO6840207.1 hypothetical protein [Thalassospira sp.]
MSSQNQQKSKHDLGGAAAIELWQKGKYEWNTWITNNPGRTVDFSGCDFSNVGDPSEDISFSDYYFGTGDVSFKGVKFGDRDVDFSGTNFGDGEINFEGAKFGDGQCNFERTIFGTGEVNFSKTCFGNGRTNFSYANFGTGDLIFTEASFGKGEFLFIEANFRQSSTYFNALKCEAGLVTFVSAKFSYASFAKTDFSKSDIAFFDAEFVDGAADFLETQFGNGNVNFNNAKFINSHILFYRSHFGDCAINLSRCQFEDAEALFIETNFGDCTLRLEQAKFTALVFKPSSFKRLAINGQNLSARKQVEILLPHNAGAVGGFDLRGATFEGPLYLSGTMETIPDLRATNSSHHVELSGLIVKLNRERKLGSLLGKLSATATNPEDAARLRRLKEIAETNKDHQAALRFSADENRARRWLETPWLSSLLDLVFSGFSNYGQSILRPFCWLIFFFCSFTSLYRLNSTLRPFESLPAWLHSALLSASNSLPFLPQSRSIRDGALKLLYSSPTNASIDILVTLQGALSFIFLFLIGLGLRNRFRL